MERLLLLRTCLPITIALLLALAVSACGSPSSLSSTPSPVDAIATPGIPVPVTAAPSTSRLTSVAILQPTFSPRPEVSPNPQESDLGQYFLPFKTWVRHIPQWMWEPPDDRQVVRKFQGADIYNELTLLDRDGNLLARFTQANCGYPPAEILWSQSKQRAVVELMTGAGTSQPFLIIDRDGNRISDLLKAYWGPMWSPTQDLLAYQALDDRLYIVDGNGGLRVSSEPFAPRACSACSVPPQWSPDGGQVALIVNIGDVARTTDIPLCLLSLDGTVSCVSLLAYYMRELDMHWLDSRYLLIQGTKWQANGPDIYRYFVFDTERQTIREVTSSSDLTPTAEPPP
jgi:hypothetical protein